MEQDEPVCEMVVEKKCKAVTSESEYFLVRQIFLNSCTLCCCDKQVGLGLGQRVRGRGESRPQTMSESTINDFLLKI